MPRTVRSLSCALALTLAAAVAGVDRVAGAEESHDAMAILSEGAGAVYQTGPSDLPKGAQISLLVGDPDKPGLFVLRVKFPANTVIAPHTHSQGETLTILSGSIYHEHGKTLDKAKGQELKAGGFVYLPKDMPHSLWTTGEPVELQVNGTGPFGLTYINPADDPSRSSQ